MRLARTKVDPEWLGEIAGALGIADRLSHRPAELSGGQQQRVAVARALAARPEVIFADEPTGALDSRSSGALLDFLSDAAQGFSQAIVVVTHDPVVASRADRVEFLVDGAVVDGLDHPSAASVLDRMAGLATSREGVAA